LFSGIGILILFSWFLVSLVSAPQSPDFDWPDPTEGTITRLSNACAGVISNPILSKIA
jgi:hypothetical protein